MVVCCAEQATDNNSMAEWYLETSNLTASRLQISQLDAIFVTAYAIAYSRFTGSERCADVRVAAEFSRTRSSCAGRL